MWRPCYKTVSVLVISRLPVLYGATSLIHGLRGRPINVEVTITILGRSNEDLQAIEPVELLRSTLVPNKRRVVQDRLSRRLQGAGINPARERLRGENATNR